MPQAVPAAPAQPQSPSTHPWDEDQAHRIAHKLVENMGHMFDAFVGQIAKDDLRSEAVAAMRRHHRRFNPAKSQYSTFAYMVGQGRLQDVARALRRRLKHEKAYAEQVMAENRVALLELPQEEGEPVHEWLERVFGAARYAYRPGAVKRGPGHPAWYSVPQCLAVALLMHKRKLSTRGCREMFLADPRLLRAVRMTHIPSHTWFNRARQVFHGTLDAHGLKLVA
jgi:hypothetical protein